VLLSTMTCGLVMKPFTIANRHQVTGWQQARALLAILSSRF
jgi:hypothetical protein